jgi:hypothetical protein
MGIWSITHRVLPFPMFDQQIDLFIKHLLGDIQLPSTSAMLEEANLDLKNRLAKGIDRKHAHNMIYSDFLWDYEKRLCELGQVRPVPESSQKIFEMLRDIRQQDPTDYKSLVFEIEANGDVTYSKQRRRP